MAPLKKIDSGPGFDEKEDLSGLVDGQKIGDGLLDAIVEDVEIFPAKASYELAMGVRDEDADVDAIDTDANVRKRLCRLLRKSGRRKDEGASGEKDRTLSMGKKHG